MRRCFAYARAMSVLPASGGLAEQSRPFMQGLDVWNDEWAELERLENERKTLQAGKPSSQRGHQR